jgi:hypothetical protein
MNTQARQTQELIEAVKELSAAFNKWVASKPGFDGEEPGLRLEMARAVGKVNGKAFILEQEMKPREFTHFQHSEHLYGTENSQG